MSKVQQEERKTNPSPPKELQPCNQIQLNETNVEIKEVKSSDLKENKVQPQENISIGEQIGQLIDCFIKKVDDLYDDMGKIQQFQGYFQKAKTSGKQIIQSLKKLRNVVVNFKDKLYQQGINSTILRTTFQFFDKYLNEKKYGQLSNYEKSLYIIDFESKICSVIELLDGAIVLPPDITNSPKQQFKQVWDHITIEPCTKTLEVQAGLFQIKKVLGMTTLAVMNESQKSGFFTKALAFCLSYPQSYFYDKDSQLKSLSFYRNPTIEMAQKIWETPENGMIRELSKLNFTSIHTNMKIYIPLDPNKMPEDITMPNQNSIQVRVLYHDSILLATKTSSFLRMSCCSNQQLSQSQQIRTIIIHMHGGGFLAMSSRSSQNYTRRWAKKLKVPVFSIDYRKPPTHRFPTAPEDCLKVYEFIVQHIHKYFRITPTKIILTGDSAGGNLACSLMALIMKNKLLIPKGILIQYPALDLRKIFSSSKVNAFTDPLLTPQMLLLCLKEYLRNRQQDQNNPLASPILLTQQFVNGARDDKRFPLQWPKTIIQVGQKDPLYDDSLRMMERMVSSNIDCKCQVYQELSHGFMSLDFVIAECNKTIQDSIKHLETLLK